MEEIILVKEESLFSVNKKLKEGWTVKMIVPVSQYITGEAHWKGEYGAYVVLQKEKEKVG